MSRGNFSVLHQVNLIKDIKNSLRVVDHQVTYRRDSQTATREGTRVQRRVMRGCQGKGRVSQMLNQRVLVVVGVAPQILIKNSD